MTASSKPAAQADTSAALGLYRGSVVCDIVLPFVNGMNGRFDSLGRLRKAGCDFVSLTILGDMVAQIGTTVLWLAWARQYFLNRPDEYVIAGTVEEIRNAKRTGRTAVNFHFQGTEALGRELAMVEAYYKLGVRFMLLAYNARNSAGTGCMEEKDDGLSLYGRNLVAEMQRVGMIVDVSHCGHRTSMEALEMAAKPCIFSHSNVAAISKHRRNITDEQIRALARTGGVIGVNGVGAFLDPAQDVSPQTVCRHIDYIAQLVGPQHVALGMDFLGEPDRPMLYAVEEKDKTVFGMGVEPPWQFYPPESYPRLVDRLLHLGYRDDEVRGILGENFLRVAAANWT